MYKMNEKKLTRQVLAAIFGISVFCGGITADNYAEAANSSLYDQYQQEQRLKELKKQVAEAPKELEAREAAKKESESTVREQVDPDNATSFADRIKSIIDKHEAGTVGGRYKRFLTGNEPEVVPTYTKEDNTPVSEKPSVTIQNGDMNLNNLPPVPSAQNSTLPQIPANRQSLNTAGRYSFDWRGTPIAQSIYGVAKIAGKGVVVNGEIKGNVYMSLKNVTCDQALDYLANAFGINWMSDGNNIIVSTGDLMKQSRVFDVAYANKTLLIEEFKSIGIDASNIYANPETGTISVTGTPYQLESASKRLSQLDKPVTQCLLLAQMIEIDHGKKLDLGMSYELPTYTHAAQTSPTADTLSGNWLEKLTFSASASASRSLSKGKVIARPMILSLNGQKGTVNFGDRVPVLTRTDTGSTNSLTVTYQNVGTKLEVTPVINSKSGDITLTINTEVSNITGWVTSGDTRAPQMSTRTATTSTHVKSGQSFVIGGLMSVNELDSLSGIPGLMDLPILGKIFSYHNRSKTYAEVYIMITPFILTENVDARAIYDELSHIDSTARKHDVVLPGHDWANDIGKHRQDHTMSARK